MPRLFKIKIQTQRNCFGGISKELTLGPSLSKRGKKIPDDSCNPPDKNSGPPPRRGKQALSRKGKKGLGDLFIPWVYTQGYKHIAALQLRKVFNVIFRSPNGSGRAQV
jgi:hypothetical protein